MSKASEAQKPQSKNSDSILSKESRIKFGFQSWNEVGDTIIGTYVGKYTSIPTKYNPNNISVVNYVLIREEDKKIMVVSGRQPKQKGVDPTKVFWDMAKVPFGARVAFIFDREEENDTSNPTKFIEIGYEGEVNKQTYLDFKSKYNLSKFAEESEEADSTDEDLEESTESLSEAL